MSSEKLRQIPSVDELKSSPKGMELARTYGEEVSLRSIRHVQEQTRRLILDGQTAPVDSDTLISNAQFWLEAYFTSSLKPVVNATGVIIHTNLGRSPLSDASLKAVSLVAGYYSSLEFNLSEGKRGTRTANVSQLLVDVTGAEEATVVNNNAAAVLLMLTAFCRDREVIISRGQLVEIGGGFRIPDVMKQSGARLVEVGTTNRTNVSDYEQAIGENSAAIMVAHHSNFKIIGFTKEPQLNELAALAHKHDLLLLFDQGSGAVVETMAYGLDHEPTVNEALEQGVDVVSFSGDKLLGGPQAGIICGRSALIKELSKHPLARAMRADKFTLAALSATLYAHLTGRREEDLPVWQMIASSIEQISTRASSICERLVNGGVAAEVIDGRSTIGGGSLPGATMPTKLVAVKHPNLDDFARFLRLNDPVIIARIAGDRLLCDPRTLMAGQEKDLIEAIIRANKEVNDTIRERV